MLRRRRPAQQGIVLLIALIILVVMALASVALLRSVSTSNVIAGNLAFQQAATTSADQATEAAIAWLEANKGQTATATANTCAVGSTVLACDQPARGYAATRLDPTGTQTWIDVWSALKTTGITPASVNNGTADSAGNTMSYVIQRMCGATGDASVANGCTEVPTSAECGNSHGTPPQQQTCTSQVYFRITVQVNGPRNTVSYTQAMVAM